MNHIMLDLETLDTRTSAVVTSIGAVAFDPAGGPLGPKFYLELIEDTRSQQARGRTISGDTVRWWMQQGAQAQQLFSEHPQPGIERTSTVDGLTRFAMFVEANGGRDVELWGNGADFDNIILGTLYDDFGMRKPWSYSRNRCYRTMKNLGLSTKKAAKYGVAHNALDDAIKQAVHLQEIFACLSPR